MKIDHIRTFLEVATSGSFSRSAERLHVTQSTISERVKAMESQFGRALFIREHSGVVLTAAGQRFLRYAEGIERLWQQSYQQVSLPPGYRTELALGAHFGLWEPLMLHWLPRMRKQAPTVALQVQTDYSEGLMRQIAEGQLDIGVVYQPLQGAGWVVEGLFEETLVMASKDPRDVWLDWIEDYVFVDWGGPFRVEHSEMFPDMEAPAISVGLGALGLQYILQNGGAGYFPQRIVAPLVEQGKLHLVRGATKINRAAYIVYTTRPKDEDVIAMALDILRDIARGMGGE